VDRRSLLLAAAAAPLVARADDDVAAALKAGGCVIAFRHALAPGTFDPPEFRLGDCRTQRNLNDEGRAQARRIGQWFQRQGLKPAAVRSSPWCRCIDTAQLAFGSTVGRAEAWPALGSPRGTEERTYAGQIEQLRAALARVPAGRFEAWVTHMFVLSDLAATGTTSGEGLVLRRGNERPEVVARLRIE
jgi:phosphohistidine phosphatase SixA